LPIEHYRRKNATQDNRKTLEALQSSGFFGENNGIVKKTRREANMAATLKDVAQRAGVSIKTVSNAVNGLGRMSDETRERVQAALVELQYQPNLPARYLRRSTVGVLALAIPDFNSYFADIGDEVISAASAVGYTVLVDHTRGTRANEALVINGLRPPLIDGVILNAMELEPEDLAAHVQIPTVLLGERLFHAPYDHVMIDNVAAAYEATHHLIQQGYQRIAAIGLKPSEQASEGTSRYRLSGYRKALEDAGFVYNEMFIKSAYYYNRVEGMQAMQELLELPEPPDAVFCFNDLLALGALHALHEAGLSIPEDIAIVGFDDIEESRYSYPTLTTISPDKAQIAKLAVEFLFGRINGTRKEPAECVEVPFELKIRQSSVNTKSVQPMNGTGAKSCSTHR
jgi:DNA-binding LacI/PurR family transcriptional regulator